MVGTAVLSDSVTVTGGDNPTGTVTFTLTAPDGMTSPEGSVTINGDNTYAAPTTVLATEVGTYTWHANYGGDTLNNAASDDGSNESVTTIQASPTISTTVSTPGGIVVGAPASNVVGTAVLSDSVTVTGGDNPTGTVTFTLTAPDGTTSPEGSVTINGDNTYTAPTTVLATEVGTYTWHANYGGDTLNDPASDDGSNESVTTTQASPTISTAAGVTNGGVVGAAVLSDSVTVTDGYDPTGTVSFTLMAPDGMTSPEGSVTINGDNTYAAPTTVLATEVGTYTWHANYGGDTLNNAASDDGSNESVTTIQASPTISTAAGVTNGGVVGAAVLSDSVTVTDGYDPTGTVTFTLTAPDGTTSPEGSVTINGDNTYTAPTTVLATEVGTYTWHANYGGDTLNNAASDNGSNESVTTVKASPTISTTVSAAGVVVGNTISDTATVSGGYGPSGTVTFNLYNNPNGTGTPLFTDANEPLSGGMATSKSYTTSATGADYWVATYNGNGNNVSVTAGVAAEPVTVSAATPTISTKVSAASVVVGNTISDTTTVSGGYNPSGTVTFNLYSNSTGTGTPLFTDTNVSLVSATATSTGYTTTATGTDYWVATYNGNANNISVASGVAAEPVAVTAATPTISTTVSTASIVVGGAISDSATVSGGYSPTGTVTFNLYNNATATGTPLSTDANEPLSGGVATSKSYTTTATGTDYWIATYNGNANNISVASGAAAEPVVVTAAMATISGTKFKDLTGNGFSSDDTPQAGVNIYLYNSTACLGTGKGYVESTTTAANGTYSFNNLPAGTYYVQEAVPAGYIQTGGGPNGSAGSTYYTISVKGGQTYGGNNFGSHSQAHSHSYSSRMTG